MRIFFKPPAPCRQRQGRNCVSVPNWEAFGRGCGPQRAGEGDGGPQDPLAAARHVCQGGQVLVHQKQLRADRRGRRPQVAAQRANPACTRTMTKITKPDCVGNRKNPKYHFLRVSGNEFGLLGAKKNVDQLGFLFKKHGGIVETPMPLS